MAIRRKIGNIIINKQIFPFYFTTYKNGGVIANLTFSVNKDNKFIAIGSVKTQLKKYFKTIEILEAKKAGYWYGRTEPIWRLRIYFDVTKKEKIAKKLESINQKEFKVRAYVINTDSFINSIMKIEYDKDLVKVIEDAMVEYI